MFVNGANAAIAAAAKRVFYSCAALKLAGIFAQEPLQGQRLQGLQGRVLGYDPMRTFCAPEDRLAALNSPWEDINSIPIDDLSEQPLNFEEGKAAFLLSMQLSGITERCNNLIQNEKFGFVEAVFKFAIESEPSELKKLSRKILFQFFKEVQNEINICDKALATLINIFEMKLGSTGDSVKDYDAVLELNKMILKLKAQQLQLSELGVQYKKQFQMLCVADPKLQKGFGSNITGKEKSWVQQAYLLNSNKEQARLLFSLKMLLSEIPD